MNENSVTAQRYYNQHGSYGVLEVAEQYSLLQLEDIKTQYYSDYVKVTPQRVKEIESLTRGQSNDMSNAVWQQKH